MIAAAQGKETAPSLGRHSQNIALDARKMNSQSEVPAPTLWNRVLAFPLVQIVVAFLFVAIPFAIVSTPFNLFVTDKLLRRAGALLLAAVALAGYSAYVRVMEKRPVTELSGPRAAHEFGTGLALGTLPFSVGYIFSTRERHPGMPRP